MKIIIDGGKLHSLGTKILLTRNVREEEDKQEKSPRRGGVKSVRYLSKGKK